MLPEVTQAVGSGGIRDPAIVASAWVVARDWGIYTAGRTNLELAVEDAGMREELEKSRRRILLDAPRQELQLLVGKPLETLLLSKLEAIGGRFPLKSLTRPDMSGLEGSSPNGPRRPAPASAPE